MYLQKVDASGNVAWKAEGVYLGEASGWENGQPLLVSDGSGGAIAVWTTADDFIRVQRVLANGTTAWPAPYEINDAVWHGWQGDPLYIFHTIDAVSDGQGGVVIAWIANLTTHLGSNIANAVKMVRILSSGYEGWPDFPGPEYMLVTEGVPAYVHEGYQVKLVADGGGGAFIVWQEAEYSHFPIPYILYSYWVGPTGYGTGYGPMRVIIDTSNRMFYPEICLGSPNEVIVAWNQGISLPETRAQKLNNTGGRLWGSNGVVVRGSNLGGGSFYPDVVSDGSGGAIVAWQGYPNGGTSADIYAQHVPSDLGADWGPNGVAVCNDPGDQREVRLERTSDGSTVAAWEDSRSGNWDVYAEKISAAGTSLWSSPGVGVPVTDGSGEETRHRAAADQSGGVIFAWRRLEDEKQNVYAMRRADGFGPPVITNEAAYNDSTVGVGEYFEYQYKFKVSWDTNIPATTQVEYRPSGTTPWSSTAENTTLQTGHYVTVSGVSAGTTYEVRPVSRANGWTTPGTVQTVTTEAAIVQISNFQFAQGIVLDGVAHVEATFSYDTDIQCSCSVNIREHQDPPVKFQSSEVYVRDYHGTSHSHTVSTVQPTNSYLKLNTFYDAVITVWPEEIPVGEYPTAEDTQFPDGFGGYTATLVYLKFKTPKKDGTGGSDPQFTETSDGRLDAGIVYETKLLANVPNPFTGATSIRFSMAEAGPARLRIYDIQGRLVKSVLDTELGRGLHQETWNGENAVGQPVNAGIYFYRLEVGRFVETKKMVLFK